ncbi:MAG: DUF4249 domain-containing protein [Bacteroidales bacterium]|nr:DUF4249 domain-containing protein [Bacteroidales bacterium]
MKEKTIYKTAYRLFNSLAIRYSISLMAALLLLAGCEDFFISEATNVDIPGSEPQLVVYSFISPRDTMIRVKVYRSLPNTMDPRNVPPVNGEAHVHMAKKGEAFTQLSYDENLMAFVINANDFAVEAGNEYTLRVESFMGESVEAECFVPGFEIDTVILADPVQTTYQYEEIKTSFVWEVQPAPSSQVRYFRSGAYISTWGNYENQQQLILMSVMPLSIDTGQEYFTHTDESARVFKGSTWGYLNLGGGSIDYGNFNRIDSVFAYVMQTDYHYYQFHKSVENYYNSDDGFIFSEAVYIYSNIKGGLGVFGGYNQKNYFWTATPEEDK